MEKINVEISWEDKNYCCGWGFDGFGAVLCSDKNIDELKKNFEYSVAQQVADMVSDGEDIPQWLADGDYEFVYTLAVSALLRQAEQFTTMAVISRFTGINQKLLSHYANAHKIPRQAQRERIVNGLHAIGEKFMAVQ